MNTKHTPGPWTLETVKTQVGHCHKIGPFPGSCGRDVGYACVYVDGQHAPDARTGKEAELLANAKLIAAAPDLLQACQAVLSGDHIGENGIPRDSLFLLVRAAIAKATEGGHDDR